MILSTAALRFVKESSRVDFGLGRDATRVHSPESFGYSWALSPVEADEFSALAKLGTLGDAYEVTLPDDIRDFEIVIGATKAGGTWPIVSELQEVAELELTVARFSGVYTSHSLSFEPIALGRFNWPGSVGVCLAMPRRNFGKFCRLLRAMQIAEPWPA